MNITGSIMRALTPADFRAFRRNAAKSPFFCVTDLPGAKPRWAVASRVPWRRSVDPVAAVTWLVLTPTASVIGWYGFYRVLRLILSFL